MALLIINSVEKSTLYYYVQEYHLINHKIYIHLLYENEFRYFNLNLFFKIQ